MRDRVWYAAFGSNLSTERFMVYLEGGTARNSIGASPGARDPSPPLAIETRFCRHRLMFAGSSERWFGGGVAFLGCDPGDHRTALRLYDITAEQFVDVLRQENGAKDPVPVDFDQAVATGFVDVFERSYGRVLLLGQHEDGKKIFTITGRSPRDANAPHSTYVRTICDGLLDGFGFSTFASVRRQLEPAQGMSGFTDAQWQQVERDW